MFVKRGTEPCEEISRVQVDDKTRPEFLVIACFEFSTFLYLPMEVFIKVTNGLVMNPEEDKRFLC